jgi:putative transcriptional regulator
MPLSYKTDVLTLLKEKGFSSYDLRKQKALSESTIQKLRRGEGISWDSLEAICKLLECQPGDLIEYHPE